jgi:hypothetical protein
MATATQAATFAAPSTPAHSVLAHDPCTPATPRVFRHLRLDFESASSPMFFERRPFFTPSGDDDTSAHADQLARNFPDRRFLVVPEPGMVDPAKPAPPTLVVVLDCPPAPRKQRQQRARSPRPGVARALFNREWSASPERPLSPVSDDEVSPRWF